MKNLPIVSLLASIRATLASHNQLILEAPTGAGKSTVLPLALLDWSEIKGRILLLEPRRVAAKNIANYLAQQKQQQVGNEIGLRIRGTNNVTNNTRLEIITEGILTRMIQQDPELNGIGLIIFDEVHERHLNTDLGLALALEIQDSLRDDLRLIIMSATLEGLHLDQIMPNAAVLKSEGRSYPVTVNYIAPPNTITTQSPNMPLWLMHMGRCILSLLDNRQAIELGVNDNCLDGSILAFLPGKAEIGRLQHFLSDRVNSDVYISLLYGDLSLSEQELAIAPAPAGKRKLVLTTNIAESSLTIEGISIVVDSGYKRQATFNAKSGITRLELKQISQASATQRAGRAGRQQAGFALRLWSNETHQRLSKADAPEIEYAELVTLAFDAAAWGVNKLAELPLLTLPPKANEQAAWDLLQDLNLVDEQLKLTTQGKLAYQLGAHPRIGRMLIAAKQQAQIEKSSTILGIGCLLTALLEARGLSGKGADIVSKLPQLLTGANRYQLNLWLKRLGLTKPAEHYLASVTDFNCGLLLAVAFPDRIAKLRSGEQYQLANGHGANLRRDDHLIGSDYLIVADYQETQGNTSGTIYLATALPQNIFDGELAHLCSWQEQVGWDVTKGRFFAERQYRIGRIVLQKQPLTNIDPELKTAAIIRQIRQKGLALLNINDNVRQLQYRVALARTVDETLVDISDLALLDDLDNWLGPYLNDVKHLKSLSSLNIEKLLLDRIGWQGQQQLNSLLPTHWSMATGTQAPIRYDASGKAMLSVRLQETFGLATSPCLLNNKLVVTMELLSPARRVLALTSDLASFWRGAYTDVKKEMRGRYPKHVWPDDPATSIATKLTKKKWQQSQV